MVFVKIIYFYYILLCGKQLYRVQPKLHHFDTPAFHSTCSTSQPSGTFGSWMCCWDRATSPTSLSGSVRLLRDYLKL